MWKSHFHLSALYVRLPYPPCLLSFPCVKLSELDWPGRWCRRWDNFLGSMTWFRVNYGLSGRSPISETCSKHHPIEYHCLGPPSEWESWLHGFVFTLQPDIMLQCQQNAAKCLLMFHFCHSAAGFLLSYNELSKILALSLHQKRFVCGITLHHPPWRNTRGVDQGSHGNERTLQHMPSGLLCATP